MFHWREVACSYEHGQEYLRRELERRGNPVVTDVAEPVVVETAVVDTETSDVPSVDGSDDGDEKPKKTTAKKPRKTAQVDTPAEEFDNSVG